jgi:hypothetical protein
MSTLRVDRIEPYLSSSIDIVGYTAATGGATTGSNVFVGNQTVTGSIDITGQFLVNGTPITGSGGSISTASFATTGSNVFQGNQNINGTLAVTASGGSELKVNNDGTVDVTSTNGFNIIGNVGIVSGGLNADGGVTASVQTNEIQVSGQQLFIGAGSGVAIAMGGNKLEVSGSIDANGAISSSVGFSGDGSGISNVNAITLDGLDSTDFVTTGSNTFNGNQTINGVPGGAALFVTKSLGVFAPEISIGGYSAGNGITVSTGNNGTSSLASSISMAANQVATIDMYANGGNYDQLNITVKADNSGVSFKDSDGFSLSEFMNVGTLAGEVQFKRNVGVTGSISLTDKIESTGKILLKPDVADPRYLNIYNTAAQDTHITASGGYLYLGDDTTYVNVNNYGTDYNIYVRADNGLNIDADTNMTGSLGVSGSIILTGSLLMTGSATFVNNGPSTFNGDTVISTIDSLPSGTPGQIAFQGGKMHVYISGQWNEVQFVTPAPTSFEFSLGFDVSDSASACSASPSNYYSDSASLNIGSFLWTGPGLATKVNNGFYAGGGTWYEVYDIPDFGYITATGSCA